MTAAFAVPASSAEICVIGAGCGGLVTIKSLKDKGIAVDAFELGSDLGGMWRYGNDNGLSSAYRSLHIDSSRRNLGYPDFPIPAHLPDFLSHAEVLAYLESYAEHFGLRPHIAFRTGVKSVTPASDQRWDVRLATGETRRYRHVIVANGHLWDPRLPDFPGTFDGEVLHSHHYRTPTPFEGKDVLVVGIGNSAVDIAVDLCRNAKSVHLSTRRSAWVMPKYLMGIPVDRWSAFFGRKLRFPTPLTRMVMSRLMRLAVGNQERFGLPRPAHPMWREHATLSQDLLPYLGHGWIKVKPDIQALQGGEVRFVDGSVQRFDAIVYATGYRTTFPFLDRSVFEVKDGADVALYRRLLAADRPGLAFIGLVQPIGPTIPLMELQARWLAKWLAGEMRLPDRATMDKEIRAHHAALRRRYVNSPRYTLEVDFRDYAGRLRRDMAKGIAGT